MKLTHKQEAFCRAYVGEAKGNATEAARRANYKSPRVQGCENLTKPYILERIKELESAIEESSSTLSKEDIHRIWCEIARDSDASYSDRLTALRDAARAKGMFIKKIEQKIDLSGGVTFYLPENGRQKK